MGILSFLKNAKQLRGIERYDRKTLMELKREAGLSSMVTSIQEVQSLGKSTFLVEGEIKRGMIVIDQRVSIIRSNINVGYAKIMGISVKPVKKAVAFARQGSIANILLTKPTTNPQTGDFLVSEGIRFDEADY